MLGLESSVMARDRQGSSNVACAAASLRPVPPGGRADHRSHRVTRIGLPGPSSAYGQRRRAHDQLRSGPEPGTTMAVPSWRRGPRGSGLSRCGLPRHVAACSRSGRDRLVNRPDLTAQRARAGAARRRPDVRAGNHGRGRGGRRVFGSPAAPRPCPADSTAGEYGSRAGMRLRLGCGHLLGGLVGAWQPGQGR
jgi:hypothetical protein